MAVAVLVVVSEAVFAASLMAENFLGLVAPMSRAAPSLLMTTWRVPRRGCVVLVVHVAPRYRPFPVGVSLCALRKSILDLSLMVPPVPVWGGEGGERSGQRGNGRKDGEGREGEEEKRRE